MSQQKKTMFQIICCLIITFLISTVICTEDMQKQKRQASQQVGLFPFPRVGRSDPDQLWDNPMLSGNSIDDYDDLPRREIIKRQGLVPFPRVGRSYWNAYSKNGGKRSNGELGVAGGFWFGPRMGRIQKRSVENLEEI